MKLNILFSGWILMPHSYSVVLTYKLVYLYKNYKDRINFFIEERPYYNKAWIKNDVFPKEFSDIINSITIYNGQKVDLIYRCTYPYNLSMSPDELQTKICVFYTSEFKVLDKSYFSFNKDISSIPDPEKYIEMYLGKFTNIYFTGPSDWSINGLVQYNVPDNRNKMITHGVDTSIFYPDTSKRSFLRSKWNVSDDDILLMNLGSLTGNKGISLIIQVLNIFVNRLKRTNYKLLLKGIKELYHSKQMFDNYFMELRNTILPEEMSVLMNHIIFLDDTLTYKDSDEINMRDLYNAGDLYVSPFFAEGFNLSPLEAISCGVPIVIPRTGSTKEYVENIFNNGGSLYIHYVDSKIIQQSKKYMNDIDGSSLINVTANFKKQILDPTLMLKYIEDAYSWSSVSHKLFNYFEEIVNI